MIPTLKAQLYGGLAFLLGLPLLVLPFYLLWSLDFETLKPSTLTEYALLIAGFLVGSVIHELIHGLTAFWYGRLNWSDIRFGVQWKSLTPYCHPIRALPAKTYRVVVAMPLIVLGLIPYAVALLSGSVILLALGVFFTLAASGDLMILWLMRSLADEQRVQDHPSQVGLLVSEARAADQI
ncbi:DUF3267 domain-containing protein [Larkinella insperata]|uniref:DUF3267 domain-containing protein n=1 Tax=Larkinella insperata TaxID=332158 RepID=A0ABW3QGL5_9BACT|nr:DUF3267 domain-containing protein [Larkinella insperata]